MNSSNDKWHVWHQVKIVVFLPLTIFLWMIGWTLYCLGNKRSLTRTTQKETIIAPEKEEHAREPSLPQVLT